MLHTLWEGEREGGRGGKGRREGKRRREGERKGERERGGERGRGKERGKEEERGGEERREGKRGREEERKGERERGRGRGRRGRKGEKGGGGYRDGRKEERGERRGGLLSYATPPTHTIPSPTPSHTHTPHQTLPSLVSPSGCTSSLLPSSRGSRKAAGAYPCSSSDITIHHPMETKESDRVTFTLLLRRRILVMDTHKR